MPENPPCQSSLTGGGRRQLPIRLGAEVVVDGPLGLVPDHLVQQLVEPGLRDVAGVLGIAQVPEPPADLREDAAVRHEGQGPLRPVRDLGVEEVLAGGMGRVPLAAVAAAAVWHQAALVVALEEEKS